MMSVLLDDAFDVRYQKKPDESNGVLLYMHRIDVGGLIGDLEDLFFNYEGTHYEFFDIEIVGWKKEHSAFIYYIQFKRMRYTREKAQKAPQEVVSA